MSDIGNSYWRRQARQPIDRRRVLSGGVTVVTGAIAVGVVGCGSSSNNTATTAATQGAATATRAATVAAGSATAAPPASAQTTATPAASPGAKPATTPILAGNFKTGGTVQ